MVSAAPVSPGRFTVRLHNFEGPFDLLFDSSRSISWT